MQYLHPCFAKELQDNHIEHMKQPYLWSGHWSAKVCILVRSVLQLLEAQQTWRRNGWSSTLKYLSPLLEQPSSPDSKTRKMRPLLYKKKLMAVVFQVWKGNRTTQ